MRGTRVQLPCAICQILVVYTQDAAESPAQRQQLLDISLGQCFLPCTNTRSTVPQTTVLADTAQRFEAPLTLQKRIACHQVAQAEHQ